MTPHFDFFTSATRTALVDERACSEGLERFDASTGMEFPGRLTRRDVGWLLYIAARRQLLPPSARAYADAAARAYDALATYDAYLATLNFQEPPP